VEYAACQVSIAPLRAQPSDKSEMVSQLLFGETVEVQESKDNWKYVVCAWDGYTGWVDAKQLKRLTPNEFDQYREHQALNLSLVEGLMAADHFIPSPWGPCCHNTTACVANLANKPFNFQARWLRQANSARARAWVVKIARRYLHAPYLWGGRSPFGIDCSGLTQMVFKTAGIRLLRDAYQQVTQGRPIDFMEECQAGDLAFFDNGKGQITHVGIILPECHIIHASGQVRVDKLDHFGIFNRELNRYTHQLRIVKRLLPDEPDAVATNENEEVMTEELAGQGALFG
jgi:uncharacterized protein YfaT (DUF1175 family)